MQPHQIPLQHRHSHLPNTRDEDASLLLQLFFFKVFGTGEVDGDDTFFQL